MGHYTIDVPYIRENLGGNNRYSDEDEDYSLILQLSTTQKHFWGKFSFGIISGYVRSEGKLPTRLLAKGLVKIRLMIRGQEEGEGQMFFGKDNYMELEFRPNGTVGGKLNCNHCSHKALTGEQCTWTGAAGGGGFQAELRNMKRKYRDINPRSYEAARTSRWKGGDRDARPEQARASDTSGDESGPKGKGKGRANDSDRDEDEISYTGNEDDEDDFGMFIY